MTSPDYDDPVVEAAWFQTARKHIGEYLHRQRVPSDHLPAGPVWAVVPYVSLWHVLGTRTRTPAFWAIYGDLPTDFIPFDTAPTARDALRAFGERWDTVSEDLLAGRQHPTIHIGNPSELGQLGALLPARAAILRQWASDSDLW